MELFTSSKQHDRFSEEDVTREDKHELFDQLLNKDTYSIEDALEKIGFGKFHILAIIIAGMAFVAEAFELVLIPPVSSALQCLWRLEDTQVAANTTVLFLGLFVSSVIWGQLADVYGRRPTAILALSLGGYYGLLSSLVTSYTWYLILRFLLGVAMGGIPLGFAYITEFIPIEYRGNVLLVFWASYSTGALLQAVLDYVVMPTLGWRWLLVISSFPFIIAALGLLFYLPESPRYCMAVGDHKQARRILEWLSVENGRPLPPGNLEPISISDKTERGSLKHFVSKSYRRLTIMLMILWFGVAFTYYGLILLIPSMLQEDEIPESDINCKCKPLTRDDYLTVIWTTLGESAAIIVTVIAHYFLGRRGSLAASCVLSSVFYLLLLIDDRKWFTAFSFFARTLSSASISILYTYTSEVYPTTIRSSGLLLCVTFAKVGAMTTPYVSQVLIEFSHIATLCLYAALSLITGFVAFALSVDTTGRPLSETAQ